MSILDFRLLDIKNWLMTSKKMYIDIWKKTKPNDTQQFRQTNSNRAESIYVPISIHISRDSISANRISSPK